VGHASAACITDNAQCKIDDSSTQTPSGLTFVPAGQGKNGAALVAINGSVIKGSNLSIITPLSDNYYAAFVGAGSTIELKDSTIISSSGLRGEGENSTIAVYGSSIITDNSSSASASETAAIWLEDAARAILQDSTITTYGDNIHGIWDAGADYLLSDPYIPLVAERVQIETNGAQAHGIQLDGSFLRSRNTASYYLRDVNITVNGTAAGLFLNGKTPPLGSTINVTMENGSINAAGTNAIAVSANGYSRLEFDNVNISSLNNTTGGGGMKLMHGSEAVLSNNTTITTQGSFAPAIDLYGGAVNDLLGFSQPLASSHLVGSNFTVTARDSIAIRATGMYTTAQFRNSRIEGDVLFSFGDCQMPTCSIPNGGYYHAIIASESQLFGHVIVTDIEHHMNLLLGNGSVWTIRPSRAGDVRSTFPALFLYDSDIVFDQAGTGLYQEVVVRGLDGRGGSSISFNTLLNEGGALSNQFTDRVLINGQVSGTTTHIYVKEVPGSPGGLTSPSGANLNNEGISLIQVTGRASEDSFTLAGGYVTMASLPYIYTLHAYGPGSSNGAADPAQQLIGSGGNHWDFRLQSSCIDPCFPPFEGFEDALPAMQVAPQLSNYLVAPIALFHAGIQDIGTLHQRLGELRQKTGKGKTGKGEGRGEFFWRGYGGDYAYRSSLQPHQYGYGAGINYAAMQAGGNLYGFETQNSLMRFGLSGSMGDLAFSPHRSDSFETKMDIWSVAPYITWNHDSGSYIDIILSYGGFDGFVTTASRGRTAKLQGHALAASIEMGMPFNLGGNGRLTGGWSIEPQAQLIHQKLKFNQTRDIDNFAVALKDPEQTTIRAGAELSKDFIDEAEAKDIKLYGSLDIIHSFNDDNKAWFGDDFDIGRSGTHIKAGLGGQIAMGDKLNLYGEASWQERVSHGKSLGGTNGLSFNIGLNLGF